MLRKIHIYQLQIPFLLQIAHNLATRTTGESIVVVFEDENGLLGFGEGTPRDYVTGESFLESYSAAENLSYLILEKNYISNSELFISLKEIGLTDLALTHPAAWCAIETACFDLLSKRSEFPLWKLISNESKQEEFEYSAILPMMPKAVQGATLSLIAQNHINFIKIKVDGVNSGVSRVKQARYTLGENVNIRVDANAAFSVQEALEFLDKVTPYTISAFEQPVAKKSLSGLQEITEKSNGVLIIADESICTIQDAHDLIKSKACHVFNIRLSKCGGFLKCMELCQLATENGIRYQIGCHVGESSILSAAGRQLASLCPNHIYLEGSFSKYMLLEDIIDEDISFGPKGFAKNLQGPGLGINVVNKKLEKWAKSKRSINILVQASTE